MVIGRSGVIERISKGNRNKNDTFSIENFHLPIDLASVTTSVEVLENPF